MKKTKKLYGNLAVLLFSIAAILVLIISMYTSVLVNAFSRYLRKSIEGRILLACKAVSELISEEEFAELQTPEDMEKPLYKDIKNRLTHFASEYDALFVYYYRIDAVRENVQPIVDNDFTENSYTLKTPRIPIEAPVLEALNKRVPVTTALGVYSVGFDGIISAFAPVFNKSGDIIAVAGVDISDTEILQTRNRTIILSILLLLSIFFVIASGFLSFIIYGKKEAAFIERFHQQALMEKLARSLIAAPNISTLINGALGTIGEFLNASRIVVAVAQPDSTQTRVVYFWRAKDTIASPAVQEEPDYLIRRSFPSEQPPDGNISIIYSGDTQTEQNNSLFAAMAEVGVRAFIMAPLYVNNAFWAVVSVEDCFSRRNWTESNRQLVSAASSIIASARMREVREQERNTALEEAKQASRAKSDFLANMSHEMRTPMNAIIGMTTIAKSSKDPEKKEYCLGKIENASTHLLGVINDILDMSKIEANKFELSFTDFNFETMLKKAVNVINFRVEEKKQIFSVHIDQRIPRYLYGDDQHLTQVITNLLSNAVKFTPEGGSIRLETAFEKEENGFCEIRISVTDSGIGITQEQQSRLFSSFQQADSSTARKFGGTGLGLAISKRIVEMMNGNIRVVSEFGNGSSFIFTIKAEISKKKLECLLGPNAHWDNIKILTVDDDENIREYFQEISEHLAFSCDTAKDGIDALERIKNAGHYDIYFIDWKLPGMNGVELTRMIKETVPANSVVIMISAQEWSVIEDDAKKSGVNKFLSKPLFPSTIADCIAECLGNINMSAVAGNEAAPVIDDFSGYRILLAEDVDINREIVLTLLEPTKLKITCAENGVEVARIFTESPEKYDMIFMDVQMPGMDGYEATRKIRASGVLNAQTIPIIAMTANVFREDVEKCLEAGMNAHIGKPLNLDEVLDKLREYLPKGRRGKSRLV